MPKPTYRSVNRRMSKSVTLPILTILKLDAYAAEEDSCPSRVIEGLLEKHWKAVGYRWELDDDNDEDG